MSGRDYDRSLQVMIGSLSHDISDHVLDSFPPEKQSFQSYEADNVRVMKFEDLYEDTNRHKQRNHRSRKKKRKKKRKSPTRRKSSKKTNKDTDAILFSHFRAKAVLFRRWRTYSKKRRIVRKVIEIFEMSARKGKLYRSCVKWTMFTMASKERDRELYSTLELVRDRVDMFRRRSYLLCWRQKLLSRNETTRVVSDRRRESVLRCFLRIWTSRVPNSDALRRAREFRHRRMLIRWHRRSRFAARRRDAEMRLTFMKAVQMLRMWKRRAERARENRINRRHISEEFLRTNRMRRGLRALIRECKLRRICDVVMKRRVKIVWNRWILASQALRSKQKERLRQILERVFRSGQRGRLYDAMSRWRRICRVQNMIAVSMVKSDRAVRKLRFRDWSVYTRRVRRTRELGRALSMTRKRDLRVKILCEWRRSRKLRYVTRKFESRRRKCILSRWRKKCRLKSIIGYASRIRERDKLEALIRWRRTTRRIRVIEFWNLLESFERWTCVARLQSRNVALSFRVTALSVGRTIRDVRASRIPVLRSWFSRWLTFMSMQFRDRICVTKCRALVLRRILISWRRALFTRRLRIRRQECIVKENSEALRMQPLSSSMMMQHGSDFTPRRSSSCRKAHRASPPSKLSPARFRAPPCFDVFTSSSSSKTNVDDSTTTTTTNK